MKNPAPAPQKNPAPRRLVGRCLLGGYIPLAVDLAVERWIRSGPKRNRSGFVRGAIQEKLVREGFLRRDPAGDQPAN